MLDLYFKNIYNNYMQKDIKRQPSAASSIKKSSVAVITSCVAAVLTAVYIVIMVFAFPSDGGEILSRYFKEYKSSAEFTSLEGEIILGEGVAVVSYETEHRVFRTQRLALKNTLPGEEQTTDYVYGLAGLDGEYVTPGYSAIISIYGDYAIVVKLYNTALDPENATAEDYVNMIGVIKYRNNGGKVRNLTDFTLVYDDSFEQMRFVTDKYGESYILVRNELSNVDNLTGRATFYDYKSSTKLLEAFKVNINFDMVNIILADDNLVVIYNSYAEFYKTNVKTQQGFLMLRDTYKPFYEDTLGEFNDYSTTMVAYLGNNWFMRWGYIMDSAEESDYQEMLKVIKGTLILMDKTDEYGDTESYYIFQRSERYNCATGNKIENDSFAPDAVYNKYNSQASRAVASYMNNTVTPGLDGHSVYSPPAFPVSALVKDGLSIVYYYYFPYANAPYRPAYSFVVLDSAGNMFKAKDNVLFPVVFVDGIGIQTDSPNYEMPYGDVQIITLSNKVTKFKDYSANQFGYINTGAHGGMLIAAEYNLKSSTVSDAKAVQYGAYDLKGKLVTIRHQYDEMSLYFGEYCIASAYIDGGMRYYRVDKNGKETRLYDVHAIRNGVYITKNGDTFGINTNSGKVLINNCDYAAVFEDFLTEEGDFLNSICAVVKDGRTRLYRIS